MLESCNKSSTSGRKRKEMDCITPFPHSGLEICPLLSGQLSVNLHQGLSHSLSVHFTSNLCGQPCGRSREWFLHRLCLFRAEPCPMLRSSCLPPTDPCPAHLPCLPTPCRPRKTRREPRRAGSSAPSPAASPWC